MMQYGMMRYELSKMYERAIQWIVWHLPRDIVYWSSIRLMCNATRGEWSNQVVPELTAMDALQRWGKK